jgi:two-component system, OmpR family, phosphate regulon response regulator PhoB
MNEISNNPPALVIEDDEKLSVIYSQALKIAGFETQEARDGQAAMDILQTARPALIVLDLHLPLISGEYILQTLRQHATLRHTLVILTTADPGLADTLQELADFVFIKPVGFSQLRDLAARLRQTIR